MGLLADDEPPAFRVENPNGRSRFLLTADHAGRTIPSALVDLGVATTDLERHIAWDIGIAGVTVELARQLDATAVLQTYSRLVVDCNRPPQVPGAFPTVSEATIIPGNIMLNDAEKARRFSEIFFPYHEEIARRIELQTAAKPIYVAMHSFTPIYLGNQRTMDVAVLYNRAPRLSKALAALLRDEGDLVVAENDPYRVTDETDYGVPVHAEARGLDYVEIEIRQDLIEVDSSQVAWAARLARLLPIALKRIEE